MAVTDHEARARSATIVLVRHADPAVDGTDDPPLSPAGQIRVHALLHALAHVQVEAVFHSEYLRTRETAEAVAGAHGVMAEELSAGAVVDLLVRLREIGRGTAVVVGHSNTVPEVISRLGGGTVPPIGPTEFDNLYIVDQSGQCRTLHLQYGAPS